MTNTYKINSSIVVDGNTDIVVRNITVSGNVSITNTGTIPKLNSNTITVNSGNVQGISIITNANTAISVSSNTQTTIVTSSISGIGIYAWSNTATSIVGETYLGYGVRGQSNVGIGVIGISNTTNGVQGSSTTGFGVAGYSITNQGVYGQSGAASGVYGVSDKGYGVYGFSNTIYGVYGGTSNTNAAAIVGVSATPNVQGHIGLSGYAFYGNGGLYIRDGATFGSSVNISGTSTTAAINSSSTINATGTITGGNFTTDGNIYASGTLNVVGSASLSTTNLSGDFGINKAWPNIALTYPSVRTWYIRTRNDGYLSAYDQSAGADGFVVGTDGSLWCRQLGDLYTFIQNYTWNSRMLVDAMIGSVISSLQQPVLCIPADGRNLSRTTYPELWNKYGTAYGAGDGSTTFGIPDLRGCVLVGSDNLGGTDASRLYGVPFSSGDRVTPNSKFGQGMVTLNWDQMPPHNHSAWTDTQGNHAHNYNTKGGVGGQPGVYPFWYQDATGTTSTNGAHGHNVAIGNAGSGASHLNCQPSAIVRHYIFAGR